MITLSTVIHAFEADLLAKYKTSLLPSHVKALSAMKDCRSIHSPLMRVECTECNHMEFIPHSCGHRNCPHCQHHESQQWLERQLKKQVPADYFLLTFTLPKELRALAWSHQRTVYSMMTRCSWETVKAFTQNDKQLQGDAGAITVLHTHSRQLDYHPHIHLVMPAAAINKKSRLWRTKAGKSKGKSKKSKSGYLFNHKALAKVIRAKLLDTINKDGLELPARYPDTWVVDCKSVGTGEKALVYLGRYLYKGVIQEKDIMACENGWVTFRYCESKTQQMRTKSVPGVAFLRLILQHVLPKGFRRARNYGFLHSNSKHLITLLQYLLGFDPMKALAWIKTRPQIKCTCCGAPMKVVETRIPRLFPSPSMRALV